VETKETTWDKPAELMTPEEMDQKGDWYWIPHDTESFIPARVTAATGSSVTAVDQVGVTHHIKAKKADLEQIKRSSLQRVVPDLVLLDIMSTPLILHNLKQRFAKKDIYTNVGSILIAINPYCALPLYTDELIRSYARRKLGQEMPPHSFNVAHDAFVGLRDFNENQSIVISGESGAGKVSIYTISIPHAITSSNMPTHIYLLFFNSD
jgi:myosin heavy subunit